MSHVFIHVQGFSLRAEGTPEQCNAILKQALDALGGIVQAAALPAPEQASAPKRSRKKALAVIGATQRPVKAVEST